MMRNKINGISDQINDGEIKVMSEFIVSLKCPNCSESFSMEAYMWRAGVFRCPKCAATLRPPKRMWKSFWLSTLGYFALLLAAGATCYAVNIDFSETFGFGKNLIVSALFWSTFVFLVILSLFLFHGLKLQLVQLTPSCGNCGSTVIVENAHFCPRCGASLSAKARGRGVRVMQPVPAPSTREAATIGPVGTCIVCKQEFRLGSDYACCPHCGSPAHKTHLLEYLHVHSQCPACQRHLDERELRQQLAREPRQLKKKRITAKTKLPRGTEAEGKDSA